MQEIRYALKTRNIELFKETINNSEDTYSKGMIKAIKTIKKYEDYMINSLRYNYSNGVLEGINNKIKLIKRVSYGYSSFYNFRLRILIVFRLLANYDKKNDIKNNLMQQNSAA